MSWREIKHNLGIGIATGATTLILVVADGYLKTSMLEYGLSEDKTLMRVILYALVLAIGFKIAGKNK